VLAFINSEVLRRDEDIDVLGKENQKLWEMLVNW
jgi:hypothetical protein